MNSTILHIQVLHTQVRELLLHPTAPVALNSKNNRTWTKMRVIAICKDGGVVMQVPVEYSLQFENAPVGMNSQSFSRSKSTMGSESQRMIYRSSWILVFPSLDTGRCCSIIERLASTALPTKCAIVDIIIDANQARTSIDALIQRRCRPTLQPDSTFSMSSFDPEACPRSQIYDCPPGGPNVALLDIIVIG